MIAELVGLVSESAVVVSESPVLASDSWLVSESWLVSDSAVLVTDSVVLVTDFFRRPSSKYYGVFIVGERAHQYSGFREFRVQGFFLGGGFKLLRLRGFRAVSFWRVEKSGRR